MQLIGFKAYRSGFVGCLAGPEAYVFFVFSKGRVNVIKRYPKSDYTDREHFLVSLHKFVPRRFFLRRPLSVPSFEAAAMADIGRRHRNLTPGAFLSLADDVPDGRPNDKPLPGGRPGRQTFNAP